MIMKIPLKYISLKYISIQLHTYKVTCRIDSQRQGVVMMNKEGAENIFLPETESRN